MKYWLEYTELTGLAPRTRRLWFATVEGRWEWYRGNRAVVVGFGQRGGVV